MDVSDRPHPLLRQFSKQIAGHSTYKGSSKPGMMKLEDGSLLKPILDPPRGAREVKFYQEVFDERCADSVVLELRTLLPEFRGIFQIDGRERAFLKMEDITENLMKPCILDIKMGARTYDPDASPEKIQKEMDKYKGTKTLGFCIPGMRVMVNCLNGTFVSEKVEDPGGQTFPFQVHRISTMEQICYGKDFGKNLNSQTVKDALRLFLNADCASSSIIIGSFLEELVRVRHWFQNQSRYAFYASSLLFVYDAVLLEKDHALSATVNGLMAVEGGDAGDRLSRLTNVRMIDFAHVFPSPSLDHNYLQGLNNLIDLMEKML